MTRFTPPDGDSNASIGRLAIHRRATPQRNAKSPPRNAKQAVLRNSALKPIKATADVHFTEIQHGTKIAVFYRSVYLSMQTTANLRCCLSQTSRDLVYDSRRQLRSNLFQIQIAVSRRSFKTSYCRSGRLATKHSNKCKTETRGGQCGGTLPQLCCISLCRRYILLARHCLPIASMSGALASVCLLRGPRLVMSVP